MTDKKIAVTSVMLGLLLFTGALVITSNIVSGNRDIGLQPTDSLTNGNVAAGFFSSNTQTLANGEDTTSVLGASTESMPGLYKTVISNQPSTASDNQ
jgi:hypothetical protein